MTYGKSGRMFAGTAILLAAGLVMAACSTSTTTGGLLDTSGKHPAGFVETHPSYARPDGSACTECHGGDLKGGISKVSCFNVSRNSVGCHANGPAFHPATWVDTKSRPQGAAGWHGEAFLSGRLINGLACSACHTLGDITAPGSGKCVTCHFTYASVPVRRIPVGNGTLHNWVPDQVAGHGAAAFFDNAAVKAVCQTCHDTNNRFGNAPHCHNCHEPFPTFHVAGWRDPDQHGPVAKNAPTLTSGFSYCQTCHGADFRGAGSAPSCVNNPGNAGGACHGNSNNPGTPGLNQAPHSPRQWRISAGTPRTHTSVASDSGNAVVCFVCHRDRANTLNVPAPNPPFDNTAAAGCFNGTLCHGNTVPHSTGAVWLAGTGHGATAKADLTYCQGCHAAPALPLAGSNPRFNVLLNPSKPDSNCENCHKARTAHPPVDPAKAVGAPRWYFHRLSGNKAVACPECHGATLQGPAEGGVGPRCEDCHRLGPPLTSPACTTCHEKPPSGTPDQFPNKAGTHSIHNSFSGVTQVCDTCHSTAGFGSGANHFMDNVVNVVFLAKYNEKGVTGAYTPAAGGSNANGGTCANVNCHGGQTTPNWRLLNGIIVDTQCTSCHQFKSGLPRTRFNDYTNTVMPHTGTGTHAAQACTVCHDTVRLAAVHFIHLDNTAAWMQAGAQTIKISLGYPGGGSECTNTPSGCH
ncbi:MAG: CxxxxCH/CxxCH domain-containing protein [bacterium]